MELIVKKILLFSLRSQLLICVKAKCTHVYPINTMNRASGLGSVAHQPKLTFFWYLQKKN